MNAMTFEEISLEQLGAQAYGHYRAGEKNNEKAKQHIKSAGLYLVEAKARVAKRKDMTWPQFLSANCDIGRSRADEIISIATGKKTEEEVHEAQRGRDIRRRASAQEAKAAVVHGKSPRITQQIQQKPAQEADPHAEIMERILAKLAGLSIDQLEAVERLIPNVR